MLSNIFWGSGFIMVGASIIVNKLYGVVIPFEILLGLLFILLGLAVMFNLKRKK